VISSTSDLISTLKLFQDHHYFIYPSKKRIDVCFTEKAEERDQLEAFFIAYHYQKMIKQNSNFNLRDSIDFCRMNFERFVQELTINGWNLSSITLGVEPNRITLNQIPNQN